MKALLIDPALGSGSVSVIEVVADQRHWKILIDPGCMYLGHLTIEVGSEIEGDPHDVIAVFDDQGEQVGFVPFSVFSPAHGARMTIYGRALVIASNDEQFADVTDELRERLSLAFSIV